MRPIRAGSTIRISGTSRVPGVTRRQLARLIRFVAAREGRRIAELDLAIVPAVEMARLNRLYLGVRGPTDVLSFDLAEGRARELAAQIVVCADMAVDQARRRGHSARREVMLYVVHGLLHLMGYDDATKAGAGRMHAREDELLGRFGEGAAFGGNP